MKNFLKFISTLAFVCGAVAAIYYFFTKNECECIEDDCEDSEEFFEKKKNTREYVSLNTDVIKSNAKNTKETILNKLDEAAGELKEKAQSIAEGVGIVKEKETSTSDFEFEDFSTEEDLEDSAKPVEV